MAPSKSPEKSPRVKEARMLGSPHPKQCEGHDNPHQLEWIPVLMRPSTFGTQSMQLELEQHTFHATVRLTHKQFMRTKADDRCWPWISTWAVRQDGQQWHHTSVLDESSDPTEERKAIDRVHFQVLQQITEMGKEHWFEGPNRQVHLRHILEGIVEVELPKGHGHRNFMSWCMSCCLRSPFLWLYYLCSIRRLTSWLCQCASVLRSRHQNYYIRCTARDNVSSKSANFIRFVYETTWFTTFQCHSSPKTVSEMPYAICFYS